MSVLIVRTPSVSTIIWQRWRNVSVTPVEDVCQQFPHPRCLRDTMRPAKVQQQVTLNCTAKGISLFILHSGPSSLSGLLLIPL